MKHDYMSKASSWTWGTRFNYYYILLWFYLFDSRKWVSINQLNKNFNILCISVRCALALSGFISYIKVNLISAFLQNLKRLKLNEVPVLFTAEL